MCKLDGAFWLRADGTTRELAKLAPPPVPPQPLRAPRGPSSCSKPRPPRPSFHGEPRVSSCIIASQLFLNIWAACPRANVVFSTKCVVVRCKTFFFSPLPFLLSLSLFYKKNLFSYHFFVCLHVEYRKSQKPDKKTERRGHLPSGSFFFVGGPFDPPNQPEGTGTGRESIWVNQSIYKCTKKI